MRTPSRWPLAGLAVSPLVLCLLAPHRVAAQGREERVEVTTRSPEDGIRITRGGNSARRLLGLTVRATGDAADTAGLLIERIADSSAAAQAGLKVGERLAALDGTTLTLDRRDIGDRAAGQVLARRLVRALESRKEGDQVSLVVHDDGRRRTVRATLRETPPMRYTWTGAPWRTDGAPRRVLGIALAEGGSVRDTAGLLITSVSRGSAAEKAGLGPGDRLVSIDGVDLRVDAADAGDGSAASARVGRLRRALDAAKDSQPVRLEVLQDGRRRTVQAVPQREQGVSMTFPGGSDWSWSEGAPMAVELRGLDALRRGLDEERRARMRELPRLRAEARSLRGLADIDMDVDVDVDDRGTVIRRDLVPGRARIVRPLPPDAPLPPGVDAPMAARGRGDRRELRRVTIGNDNGDRFLRIERPDLDVASVNAALAAKLGRGTEGGLLVLRVTDDHAPLRTGDVIMKVDGAPVTGPDSHLDLDRARSHRIEVIRDGRTETLELKAR
ncbi:MAG: PDZ domain-containing protein [Gemmatimonadaceae bacterium]|nr:PDZ domain-containing protein [Gemmatimonadaceae bacterium]